MAVLITDKHAYSLKEMVKWFRKMIVEREVGTPELTAAYCDELMKDLCNCFDWQHWIVINPGECPLRHLDDYYGMPYCYDTQEGCINSDEFPDECLLLKKSYLIVKGENNEKENSSSGDISNDSCNRDDRRDDCRPAGDAGMD